MVILVPVNNWILFTIIMSRAGYHSKIFDTDTLTSMPVPERYFFQYQFYEIQF